VRRPLVTSDLESSGKCEGHMSGKLFAVLLILIALGSAVPVITHTFLGANVAPPEDISTHGSGIDQQMDETMIEAGLSFLAAQIVLGIFVWQFGGRKDGVLKNFPGGAKYLVLAAVLLVGAEVLALGAMGSKAWAKVYFQPASADALPIQVQAGQFAFYFRYAGPDGKFGIIHPEKIDEGNSNFFGLDPENDVAARDDIQSGELVVPVNKEIHLMMHAKDVGHSFYVRELRIQQDFVPGLDLSMHFTATKPGKYEIVCTQLCGLGHYNMRGYLTVMTQEDFEKWLKSQSNT
jgi:cytochrome c oxidase subunit II